MRGRGYKTPQDQWIIVENTHEAIISKELWDKTQRLFHERAKPRPDFSNISPIAGMVICKECGAHLSSSTWGKEPSMICGTYKRMGKKGCTPHLVPKQLIIDTIMHDLNTIIAHSDDLEKKISEYTSQCRKTVKNCERQMEQLDAQLDTILNYKKKSFESYQEGLISKADFQNFLKKYEEEENAVNALKNKLLTNVDTQTESEHSFVWLEKLLKYGKIEALDRGIVADMVDKIIVSDQQEIKIIYRFSDEMETLL